MHCALLRELWNLRPFQSAVSKTQNWLTILMSPPNPPELLPPVVNLDCTMNFMIVDTAPETTSCWFPDPPALLNSFIPSDMALLISCSLDPPLEDPPDVNCLMTCKNPQRAWRSHRIKKAGLTCRAAALPIDLELIPWTLFWLYAWSWARVSSSSLTGFSCSFCAMVISSQPKIDTFQQRRTVSFSKLCTWEVTLDGRPCWEIVCTIEPRSTVETDRDQKDSRSVRSFENLQEWSEPPPCSEWWGELYCWPPVLSTWAIDERWSTPLIVWSLSNKRTVVRTRSLNGLLRESENLILVDVLA